MWLSFINVTGCTTCYRNGSIEVAHRQVPRNDAFRLIRLYLWWTKEDKVFFSILNQSYTAQDTRICHQLVSSFIGIVGFISISWRFQTKDGEDRISLHGFGIQCYGCNDIWNIIALISNYGTSVNQMPWYAFAPLDCIPVESLGTVLNPSRWKGNQ